MVTRSETVLMNTASISEHQQQTWPRTWPPLEEKKKKKRGEKRDLAGYPESQTDIGRKFRLEALELSMRMTGVLP